MCPTIADAGEVILTERGCLVGGMLILTLEVHFLKLPNMILLKIIRSLYVPGCINQQVTSLLPVSIALKLELTS